LKTNHIEINYDTKKDCRERDPAATNGLWEKRVEKKNFIKKNKRELDTVQEKLQ
jgi:hypothetical protein